MISLVGQSLGRYHVIEQLGEGGMAVVYKAFDTRLERDVAIKIIRRGAFPPEQLELVLKRFEREAKSLARLSHPNIVKVLDYGEYEGSPYLVLEYLPGGTLKGHMGHAFSWQEAVRLLLPVARALSYAHQQGIIHRDVKPSNVLMTQNDEPMLTDFGIAKILEVGDAHTLTASGVGIGTPDYMAPEQGMGSKVDARADIYSLGIIFYELVAGRKPYIADTPMAVVLKHMTDPLPRPANFAPDLPEFVENVIIKTLAKSPDNRYANMREVVVAFEKMLAEATLMFPQVTETLPVPQVAESRAKVAEAEKPVVSVVPPTEERVTAPIEAPKVTEEKPRRQLSLPIALLGVVILAILALAWWAINQYSPAVFAKPTPKLNLSSLPGNFVQTCGMNNDEICITNSGREILKSIQLPLPEASGQIDDLAWAPDGQRLVLAIWRTKTGKTENDLFVYKLASNELKRLTKGENNVQPAWSPNGQWIAYHSSGRAMLISPDGTSKKHLSAGHDSGVIASSFAWSPNSEWLAWLVRESTPIQTLKGLMLYSMQDQSLAYILFAPGDTTEIGYELLWDPYGKYLYIWAPNFQARRFDMSCLPTSCNELESEMVSSDVPQEWSKHYYPQWQVSRPNQSALNLATLPTTNPLPAAAVTPQNAQMPAKFIKIALQAPLSGGQASAGVDIQRAAELAFEQISGPLKEMGFGIEFISFDDQAKREIGVENAKKIAADEAFLCGVGHFNSGVTIPASEIYHTAGIPFISPTSTSPLVTDRRYLEMNRVIGRDDVQGVIGAQYAQTQGFKSVFIIQDGSDYGKGLAGIFRREAERLRLKIVGAAATSAPKEFAQIATKIAAEKPDFVFLAGLYDQTGPLFKQIRAAGYAGTLMGGDGLDSPDLVKLGGPSLLNGGGVLYSSTLVNPKVYPDAAGFIQDFQDKYNVYPQPFAAPAYDAMSICLKAVENAARAKNGEIPTRREVAEAIRALKDFKGITNIFTFNDRGDPLLSKYMVVRVVSADPARWSQNEVIQVLEIAPPKP